MVKSSPLTKQHIQSLSKIFVKHLAFSVFGKNKHSKLLNLLALSLNGAKGYGNFQASLTFSPIIDLSNIDCSEISRRLASTQTIFHSPLPFVELHSQLTNDIEYLSKLTRNLSIHGFISSVYNAVRFDAHQQREILSCLIDDLLQEELDINGRYIKPNIAWASFTSNEINWLSWQDLKLETKKKQGTALYEELEKFPHEISDINKKSLKEFFDDISIIDIAIACIKTLQKSHEYKHFFDAKALIYHCFTDYNYTIIECLDPDQKTKYAYKLYKNAILLHSSGANILCMAELDTHGHNVLNKMFNKEYPTEQQRANDINNCFLKYLASSKQHNDSRNHWNDSLSECLVRTISRALPNK